MILNLTILLGAQLTGEIAARALVLPVPGPVLGLCLLLILFMLRPVLFEMLRPTASGLLAHLSLLFVPAGVGVMGHLDRLGAEGLPLLLALVGSTTLAIAVGAATFVGVLRLTGGRS